MHIIFFQSIFLATDYTLSPPMCILLFATTVARQALVGLCCAHVALLRSATAVASPHRLEASASLSLRLAPIFTEENRRQRATTSGARGGTVNRSWRAPVSGCPAEHGRGCVAQGEACHGRCETPPPLLFLWRARFRWWPCSAIA